MAADTDRPFGMQPFFALLITSRVEKCIVAATKHAVRNQLFVTGILFCFRTSQIPGVHRIEKSLQVGLYVRIKPLEVSDLVEEQRWNDKNMLNGRGSFGHDCS